MNYKIQIRDGEKKTLVAECRFTAKDDTAATKIMSDLLLSIAKHNNIEPTDYNTNLYNRTEWINGI